VPGRKSDLAGRSEAATAQGLNQVERLAELRRVLVLDLATAIRKLTSMTVEWFGLADRGTIGPRAYADLVAFDRTTVIDTATFESPLTAPIEMTGARPGRVLCGVLARFDAKVGATLTCR
jgi:N-acyl-D-aspartate/D-glutamate deacylase